MMKLIGTPTSPYTRKARIVLAEKRIEYEFAIDIPYDAQTQVPAHNPLGKVPVLLLDDDTAIFDSRVIVEYLDLRLTEIGWRRTYPNLARLAEKLLLRASFKDTVPTSN